MMTIPTEPIGSIPRPLGLIQTIAEFGNSEDLLDMSRITTGKLQVRQERVELATVVRSAVESVRPLIDEQRHQLSVTLPPAPVLLDADPMRLAQVFSNLLNNAAKYSESGGRIALSAEASGNEVVVRVSDTGVGIADGDLRRIFDMLPRWTWKSRDRAADWASVWRWSRVCWRCTAARSRPTATVPAEGASSRCDCRSLSPNRQRNRIQHTEPESSPLTQGTAS